MKQQSLSKKQSYNKADEARSDRRNEAREIVRQMVPGRTPASEGCRHAAAGGQSFPSRKSWGQELSNSILTSHHDEVRLFPHPLIPLRRTLDHSRSADKHPHLLGSVTQSAEPRSFPQIRNAEEKKLEKENPKPQRSSNFVNNAGRKPSYVLTKKPILNLTRNTLATSWSAI